MKRIQHLLAPLFVLVVLASCGKKVEVTLGETAVTFAPEGATIEVALTSNGTWNVDSYPEWLTLSPTSGSGDATLTLTAPANGTTSRSGEVHVSTKDYAAKMTVTQEPRTNGYLLLSLTEIEAEAEGGTYEIAVIANCEWTVTNNADWVSCDPSSGNNSGNVTITIDPIEGDVDNRQTIIVFAGTDDATASVNVIQRMPQEIYLSVDPTVLAFDYVESTLTANLSSNGDWTAFCDADWVTLSLTSGSGDAQIDVTVTDNPLVQEARVAQVNFQTSTGVFAVLEIKQEGAPDPHFLEVTPDVFNFGKEGGTAEITIECDADWYAVLQSDWVSLSALEGTGNSAIILTVAANAIAAPRSADFSIVSGFISRILSVRQDAGDEPVIAYFEPDTLYPTWGGGFQHVNLISNVSWQLESTASWISMVPPSGEGDASFDILIDLNSGTDSRTGYLNATHNEQLMCRLVVVQESKPNIFETDITELDVHSDGGDFVIHLTANQSWSLNWDVDWMNCSPESGSGNSDIVVHVEASNNPRPRTGNIKIVGSTGAMIIVTVNQHD